MITTHGYRADLERPGGRPICVVDQSTVAGIDLHDLRHPNTFGYSKMAYNWYRAMAKVFRLSGDTGANPYAMQSAHRCLTSKVSSCRHRFPGSRAGRWWTS